MEDLQDLKGACGVLEVSLSLLCLVCEMLPAIETAPRTVHISKNLYIRNKGTELVSTFLL